MHYAVKSSTGTRGGKPMTASYCEEVDYCMVDTNVLVYATIEEAPRFEEARQWMTRLQREGIQLCATPQVYREYLVVLTRGSIFNRSFSTKEASEALAQMRPAFRQLIPTSETFETLMSLVRRYRVQGKQTHDANIVAVMVTYGIEAFATYNQNDFQRFEEIRLLVPSP